MFEVPPYRMLGIAEFAPLIGFGPQVYEIKEFKRERGILLPTAIIPGRRIVAEGWEVGQAIDFTMKRNNNNEVERTLLFWTAQLRDGRPTGKRFTEVASFEMARFMLEHTKDDRNIRRQKVGRELKAFMNGLGKKALKNAKDILVMSDEM